MSELQMAGFLVRSRRAEPRMLQFVLLPLNDHMETPSNCPICGFGQFETRVGGSSREYTCNCNRCGNYYTTHEFLLFHHDRKYDGMWHKLSGLIREINEDGEVPLMM